MIHIAQFDPIWRPMEKHWVFYGFILRNMSLHYILSNNIVPYDLGYDFILRNIIRRNINS